MSRKVKRVMPVTDVAADTPLAAANEVQEHADSVAAPVVEREDASIATRPVDDNPTSTIVESPFVNPMLEKKLTPEQQEKVDNYDRVSDENANLVAENADLKEKIAEYIAELDTLRSKPVDDTKLKDTEKKLVEAEKKISELEREVKSLQDANDKYLMKISDLTFENAKLTAEAQSKEPVDITPDTYAPAKPSTTVEPPKHSTAYRNVYRTGGMNGYSDWN